MSRSRMRAWIVVLALVVAAPFAVAVDGDRAGAQASDPGRTTWGIAPASELGSDGRAALDLVVSPGDHVREYVSIRNFADADLDLDVYAADAVLSADSFDVGARDEATTGVGAWSTVGASTVRVPARGEVVVPIDIEVPANAEPGDHAGGVVASRLVPNDAAGSPLATERRVGTRIYLRVAGPIDPQLTVRDLDAGYRQSWVPFAPGAVDVEFTVENTGNLRLSGVPEVTVTGPFGWGRRAAGADAIDDLLPGHSVTRRVRVERVFPLARLSVEVTLRPSASAGQVLDGSVGETSDSTTVAAVPYASLVVVAVVVVALWWWRRRTRTRGDSEAPPPGERHRTAKGISTTLAVIVVAAGLVGCGPADYLRADDDRIQVVTTTGILRDLAANVGGSRVHAVSLVPDGGDPHTYEPTLRDVRNVVYADAAFSNYMLLEEHSIIKALDANLRAGVPNISLAEGAVKYAAEIIPLVEDVTLDTIWLGMRVRGDGDQYGANRSSDVLLRATGLDGPGHLVAYLTEPFGAPTRYVDSTDGFDPRDGYRGDTAVLPPAAHTHMSWAFTEPGTYRLTMAALLAVGAETRPVPIDEATFTFAVGIDPHTVMGIEVRDVLGAGHADVTVDLDTGALHLFADLEGGGEHSQVVYDPATTVIEVPTKALHEIPAEPGFRFLGAAGDDLYQLPQAVLGKHVHGEIDPHLWHDARNAMAYVELMRDTLIGIDPAGALEYRANAEAYIAELEALDAEVRATIASIPTHRRHLVTTHDAFAYLGKAYDLAISGFVTPNPASEPTIAQRRKLTRTIQDLDIPAVFLEPNLVRRSSTLTEVAKEQGVAVCPIYGDAFDDVVTTYVELMRFNARSLSDCLSV